MTKLVWKTIAITLASALGALMLAFGALALFSPVTLAKFFDGAGNRGVALFYYEKQYQKTGDINDLGVLVLKIDDENNSRMAEKYLADLVLHKGFDKYCQKQDLSNSAVSSVEYYYGRYVCVLYERDTLDKVLAVCKSAVEKYGYTDYNPYTYSILQLGNAFDLTEIESYIASIESLSSLDAEQENNRIKDLQELNSLKSKL